MDQQRLVTRIRTGGVRVSVAVVMRHGDWQRDINELASEGAGIESAIEGGMDNSNVTAEWYMIGSVANWKVRLNGEVIAYGYHEGQGALARAERSARAQLHNAQIRGGK